MLVRVRDFGVQYAASFPAGSRGHELFTELSPIVEEIEQLGTAQQSNSRGAREGTTNRGEARTDLREAMEAISETARSMALDTPGLEDKFRLPRGKINDVDLINTARAFASDALPLKDQFIRHEMPADFLDKLNAYIEAFEQAIDTQQRSQRSRVSATTGLDDAVERGVNKVRQLDAVVRNKFRDEVQSLTEWETARHTTRAPAAPAPSTQPPAPSTPTT
jgi:hypothetical protein